MKALVTSLGGTLLLFALVGLVFGAITGTVWFDDGATEEAPCCVVTLHPLTDCTGNQLDVTGTDSCGVYALSNVAPDTWYGVKVHFNLTFCAAAYGEGDCPETIVCDSVRTNRLGDAGLDFTVGLDSCDNVGCD